MGNTAKFALVSLVLNMAFALYHLVLSLLSGSWWLLTLGSYYLVLTAVRFVVLCARKSRSFVVRFTGIMLMILSVPLVGTVILSFFCGAGRKYHIIVMIAMAAYAFAKITLATVNLIKFRRSTSAALVALRNISFADAFASIFALQRSMLITFEGMNEGEISVMNIALGSAVCITVFLLGCNLTRHKKVLFQFLNP